MRTLRGDLPNTDYPIGSTSRAKELGINRLTHDNLTSAEKLATSAALVSDYPYPVSTLREAYDSMLFHDGHTGGMFDPIGIAQDASWSQKSEFAYRAAALAQDVLVKSANRIADAISLGDEGYYIVVFNPLAQERTDLVRMPGLALSPCNRPLHWRDAPPGEGDYRIRGSSSLIGRGIVNIPVQLLESAFDLVDLTNGRSIPHQIIRLKDHLMPRPYASQSWSLGNIDSHSLDGMNFDRGHLLELVFQAGEVPSLGLRTYHLAPTAQTLIFDTSLQVGEDWIENRFYRLELDPATGAVARLYDKSLGCEWIDANAPHDFNRLVVRSARSGKTFHSRLASLETGERGPLLASLIIRSSAPGVPQISQEITLYDSLRRIDFANRILKDATPLQELYFAFPFAANKPHFRYEASNAVIEPIREQLPGTNTDVYAAQHWMTLWDAGKEPAGVVWTSLEALMMEVGGLWPGYVSQAHHGATPPGYGHEFLRHPEQLVHGHIYSDIMDNNFRTNFEPSQVADALFRYSLTSFGSNEEIGQAWKFGWGASTPLEPVCIRGPQDGRLSVSISFCQVDAGNVHLLTLKVAEDGDGLILRLAEMEGRDILETVTLPQIEILQAFSTNLVEENRDVLSYSRCNLRVPIDAHGLATVRCKTGRVWTPVSWLARF